MQTESRFADFLSRAVLCLLLVAACVGVFVWYLPMIQKNQTLREEIIRKSADIAQYREKIGRLKRNSESFKTNNVLLERLARERYSYARTNEIVFHLVPEP